MVDRASLRECPVCSRTTWSTLDTLGHRTLARCTACDHEFVADFDATAIAAEYRAAYYADAADPRIAAWATTHRPVWDAIVDQLSVLHPTARHFLDVGAGRGGFLARLQARHPAAHLAAVESSTPAREALRRQMPDIVFVAEAAEDLPQCSRRFDVITMLQTLEHLTDPLAALRGALHCLQPGGLLFVTVPNRRSLAVLRHGRGADCYANGTHLHFFAASSLFALLRRAGFTGIHRHRHFGGGQTHSWLAKGAQYLLRACGWSTELRVVARAPDRGARGSTTQPHPPHPANPVTE